LNNITIPEDIIYTGDMDEVLNDKPDIIIFAVPSQATRAVAEQASRHIKRKAVIISASKGLEKGTCLRMSQVIASCFPKSYPVIPLVGPTHAEEVAKGLPSAIVAGSRKKKVTSYIQKALSTPTFRIYSNTDTIGVEIASSLKNIIAIAAGLADGLGWGDNTKSALVTRGLAEMVRFGKKFGAKERTFYGLAGMGDLITTCTSEHGRNLRLGKMIAKGIDLKEAREQLVQVTEGVKACTIVKEIAMQKKIDMPITMQVYNVLFEGIDPKQATISLMERKVKREDWGHA
jgi:glycerol-3-phosphate dehydrogenase (NAD(P)+)